MHWSDGGLIDVDKVGAALRRHGAAFLIDATQGAGVVAMDVKRLDPDFVIVPDLQMAARALRPRLLYVAKRHQNGVPLEQTSAGRRDVRAENAVYFTDLSYVPDARRFDMGERDYFISMEMASIGMEMVARLGRIGRCATSRDADGADRRRACAASASRMPDAHLRAPHILRPRLQGAECRRAWSRDWRAKASTLRRAWDGMRVSPHVLQRRSRRRPVC